MQRFFGGSARKSLEELNASANLSAVRREQTAKMLKELGLAE